LHLLGYIIDAGKALVIAVNKWDGLPEVERTAVRKALDRRLQFVTYARIRYISALHGTGVGDLFPDIEEAWRSASKKLSTPRLTQILNKAVESHQPPAVMGRRIELRSGENPFQDRKNELTPRQIKRRQRLLRHVKKR
jgi:GTPase